MKSHVYTSILAGLMFAQVHSASAQLAFGRGTESSVGTEEFSSSVDDPIITGALTGPETIDTSLYIPVTRVQYDTINNGTGTLNSWTVFYSPKVASEVIGATTPTGYSTSSGGWVNQGGVAYTTLLNKGFGVYNYNIGAPWLIDYQPNSITFTALGGDGLAPRDGAGFFTTSPGLPSFDIDFSPNVAVGFDPASAMIGNVSSNGEVIGAVPEPSVAALGVIGASLLRLRSRKA